MKITTFRDLYLTELQEARSLEKQLVQAMPKLVEAASDAALKDVFNDDVSEVRAQVERLTALLEAHGVEPREHKDQSMQTILAEAEKWAGMIDDPALRDAALIASAQRVQHYEIAVYGSLAAWAKQLGLDDLDTLLSILEEERAADAKLTELAKRSVNVEAAA